MSVGLEKEGGKKRQAWEGGGSAGGYVYWQQQVFVMGGELSGSEWWDEGGCVALGLGGGGWLG